MSLKRAKLAKSIELRNYTTIKIGGRAGSFFLVDSLDELHKVLAESGPAYYFLGKGSNLLITDSFIEKPIIKLGKDFNYIKQRKDCIEAGAATQLSALLHYCLVHNLSGLENLVGIPATVGGLLSMNASSYGEDISSKVSEVAFVDDQGNIRRLKRKDLVFGYRSCLLENSIVIWVRFNLSGSENLKQRLRYFIQRRLSSQDFSLPSCGCIFKNPKGKSAGWLIESCGLKGVNQGGAQISPKHANFIVNNRGAKYNDVEYLIQKIKSKVYEKYSIILSEEIKRWS